MKGIIRALVTRKKELTEAERLAKARELLKDLHYVILPTDPEKFTGKSRIRGIE